MSSSRRDDCDRSDEPSRGGGGREAAGEGLILPRPAVSRHFLSFAALIAAVSLRALSRSRLEVRVALPLR